MYICVCIYIYIYIYISPLINSAHTANRRGTPTDLFELRTLLLASNACIGGPATASALAVASGWEKLLVPSILVGNLGYAVATFLGIGFYRVCRGF